MKSKYIQPVDDIFVEGELVVAGEVVEVPIEVANYLIGAKRAIEVDGTAIEPSGDAGQTEQQ